MPNTHTTLTSLFSDIADAIRGKTGSSATIVADDFPTAIANIPTGGGSATIQPLSVTANGTYTAPSGVDGYSPITVNVQSSGVTTTEEPNSTGTTLYINSGNSGGVRFIDYDGTILHSYSASEFANLTAMPANPSHTGLTAQGWNWTLSKAKTYVAAYGMLDIGQMYITDDNTTRIYITLMEPKTSPVLGICPNGTVVINWGDNTATDTLTGTSLTASQSIQHTYASTGDYIITLTVTNGEFAISGTSNGTDLIAKGGYAIEARIYRNAIKKIELGANVSLRNYCFYYCTSLKNITIPSHIINIGDYAFQYCYSLESIIVPINITTINSYTFHSCNSLKIISIPSGITSIGNNAFRNCRSLSMLIIPDTVTSINNNVFYDCQALQTIIIPTSVASIGTDVFYDCCSLKTITVPNSVTIINNNTFYNCSSLETIILPNTITSLGNNSFRGCYALKNITIPNSVTSIGTYAFYECKRIENITIPNGVTNIPSNCFSYNDALKNITLPNSITTIGSSAFYHCISLQTIVIPNTVTSIGTSAFSNCEILISFTLPSGITAISSGIFQYDYSLAKLIIPSGVTTIDAQAFFSCTGIGEYHILSATPPSLANTNAFTNIAYGCKIYVPAESLTAYQEATNWSTYASYMVGE